MACASGGALTRHPRRLTAVIALCAAVCAAAAGTSLAASGASCSAATAKTLEVDRVARVACGAFAGPGSHVMLVNLTTGVCMPFVRWDVFLLRGSVWKQLPLPDHGGLTGIPAVPVKNGIRETINIRRPSDLLCNPTGGTKARVWRWNGSTFVPGAWTYSKGAYRPGSTGHASVRYISSPTGNIQCTIGGSSTYCQTFDPPQHVSMDVHGTLDICRHQGCAGNAGEGVHFTVVPYGHSVSAGGVRCSSAFSGMTCTLTATGKGFVIARAGIRRVG